MKSEVATQYLPLIYSFHVVLRTCLAGVAWQSLAVLMKVQAAQQLEHDQETRLVSGRWIIVDFVWCMLQR